MRVRVCKLLLAFGKCNQDQPQLLVPGKGLRLQFGLGLGLGLGLGWCWVSGLPVEAGGDDFHKLARLANAATKLKMPRHAQRNAVHPPPLPHVLQFPTLSNKFNDLLVRKSATKAASLKQQQQQQLE